MSIRQRITDTEVRKKLKAFREKKKRRKLEDAFSDVFKDCKVDKDVELDYGIGDYSSDRPSVFDHDETHEDIIESYDANETIFNTDNSLTNLDGNRLRRIPDIAPPRGPIVDINEPPLDPFWTKVWFKYGLPTGLGVTASLLEIWRALS